MDTTHLSSTQVEWLNNKKLGKAMRLLYDGKQSANILYTIVNVYGRFTDTTPGK